MTPSALRTLALSAIEAAGDYEPSTIDDAARSLSCAFVCDHSDEGGSCEDCARKEIGAVCLPLARALLAALDANEELRRLARREHST